ncbi:MarR family winged helix-turn-helix transcriptional regulator [Sphaerisporangium fuscum]|uniref:MarR family winged helix-turn-helix transcriptional regulator n=1 Tax=Sphaerisporangium fuscum TaxID=2835868 RepID=UPI001BDD6C1E|nr:MarR family transcriptional regulator [Sphaerisporangium fuscum]
MASEESCGELLVRLSDVNTVIRAVKREMPFAGPRSGLAMLMALARCGELRLGELADLFDVDQSVVSRHVADLQEHGWIERIPNPRDGRSWYVRLAPDGGRIVEEATAHVRQMFAGMLQDWDDEEIAELAGLLARLRASFDARRGCPSHFSRAARPHEAPRSPKPKTAATPRTARTAQTAKGN